jgi:ABC-type multidrug transport system ATPase subunit
MSSEIIIQTKNLTKDFGRGKKLFRAVDNVNITVKKGEIHGFLGPNGAGKTTTIKMLVGALNPTKGEATIMGKEIGSIAAKQLLGYSPERPCFYEDMSSIEYLSYIGMLCGLSGESARKRGLELLKWLELSDAHDRKIKFFSAGMKQKLSIAQALIHEPEILILDEPTANLDPIGRANIIDKITKLVKEKNITIFVSSHILAEIEKMADTVTILNKGKVLLESEVKSLKKHFEGNHFVISSTDNNLLLKEFKAKSYVTKAWIEEDKLNVIVTKEETLEKDLPKVLTKNHLTLESFGRISLSLENIFMDVVGEKKNAKT